jgi:hypothetical protein
MLPRVGSVGLVGKSGYAIIITVRLKKGLNKLTHLLNKDFYNSLYAASGADILPGFKLILIVH